MSREERTDGPHPPAGLDWYDLAADRAARAVERGEPVDIEEIRQFLEVRGTVAELEEDLRALARLLHRIPNLGGPIAAFGSRATIAALFDRVEHLRSTAQWAEEWLVAEGAEFRREGAEPAGHPEGVPTGRGELVVRRGGRGRPSSTFAAAVRDVCARLHRQGMWPLTDGDPPRLRQTEEFRTQVAILLQVWHEDVFPPEWLDPSKDSRLDRIVKEERRRLDALGDRP